MALTSFHNDGFEFGVVDSGPADGDVVVLLHGFPQRPSSWAKVAARLNAEGFRTVAPEQRGYAPGARPKGRRAYRGDRLVSDVVALIEELGVGPVHLVGHDWGSAVAWGVATRSPELVRSLVAVSVPHPGAFMASMLKSDQWRRSWYMAFFQLPFLPERLVSAPALSQRFLGAVGMDRAMIDRFHTDFPDAESLRGPLGWYRALPFADRGDLSEKVRVPTTLVWSDRDKALGRKGAELTERYVDAPYRLEVLEGVSHWIPEQAADQLADAILERARGTG